METWKNINSKYQVSNLGNIKNNKGEILKPYLSGNGYLKIKLGGKQYLVHRLVASAFCEKNGFREVDHINANKLDNRAENLEWVSHKENCERASSKKLMTNKSRNIKVSQKGFSAIFNSCSKAAKQLGISIYSIRSALATGYNAKGYSVEYAYESN